MEAIDDLLGTSTKSEIDKYESLFKGIEGANLSKPDYSLLEGTAFDEINLDPQSRDAQLRAMELIADVADDGMTAQDQSILGQITRQQNTQDRMNRGALEQSFARRGTLGGGGQLAAQMLAQQGGAEMAALRGLEAAGQASARRQGAIGQLGQQAGMLRGQDYNQAAQRAQARDVINRFNTDTRNRGMDMGNQLAQQEYDNRLRQATGQSGAYQMGVQDKSGKRQAATQFAGSAMQTGGQLLGSIIEAAPKI